MERMKAQLTQLLHDVNGQLASHEHLQMLVVAPEPWSMEAGTLTPTVVPYEQYPDCLYDKSMIELITHSAQQELKLYGYQPPITC